MKLSKLARSSSPNVFAACVNIIDKMHSIYWWDDQIQENEETVLIAKTSKEKMEALTIRVKDLHSYSCPCVIALPIKAGNQDYLQWVIKETNRIINRKMNTNTLKTELHDHIFWARIDRPETLNAIDFDTMEEIEQILDSLENNSDIRVFILSGNGNEHFTSGGDLQKFSKLTNEDDGRLMARRMSQILERVEALDCWTIACINGNAYGGGCEITLAFDFRVALIMQGSVSRKAVSICLPAGAA